MSTEKNRLSNSAWKKWGTYVSDRQWGTVREDYSDNGDAWNYTTHDTAVARAYRWGEEGIGGISDDKQLLCFAWSFWNGQDYLLKERLFGLTGGESNHGEDVKELYYYLDATPSHSYQKMLYKYPQAAFPYENLREISKIRTKLEREYELIDTGIFNENRYFDIFIEYAKASENDILIKLTIINHGDEEATINALPTIWFRNTWEWGYDAYKPILTGIANDHIEISHHALGELNLYCESADEILFCDNESNLQALYGAKNINHFQKDGINNYVVNGNKKAVNSSKVGTKASANYKLTLQADETKVIRLRLTDKFNDKSFDDFDQIFAQRIKDADEFYAEIQQNLKDDDKKMIQRQAFAGMLWSKQFFYYNINQWLKGDPSQPTPPDGHATSRNASWRHFNSANIISMPDAWEYPWFAAWDLAFHTLPLGRIDIDFSKNQLKLLLQANFLHPSGQIPAYEWNFSDVNPPVHAWATWKIYCLEKEQRGTGDYDFLESVFEKLLLNFTWWVNQKDEGGNNIFEGGFLGLDNIGVFDRSAPLPTGGHIEQSDGTSWMAMFCLNMLQISCELATQKSHYQGMAAKFFSHFLYIAGAMEAIGGKDTNLWNEDDQFYYDMLRLPSGQGYSLKVRSMVGLIPLFAVEVLSPEMLAKMPEFKAYIEQFLAERSDLAALISRFHEPNQEDTRLLSLLRGHRMKMLIKRMVDPDEFLSDFGVRALSKYHLNNPYQLTVNGQNFSVKYLPAESDSGMFGGNSNWRGPIWFPVNFLLIDSLKKFHAYYGDDFLVEFPTNSGKMVTIKQIADELTNRLVGIFQKNEDGSRAVFGSYEKFQTDPNFNNYLLFHEYFNGDNGSGIGASHQTGWTGLIAELLME